jgi:ABC-type polysaccharide/polyol phosphate transport system ATPase subunit
MREVVIKTEQLSKKYRLGVINRRMLVDQIESWVCRKIGRPDPHASVFEKHTDRMPTPQDFWALQEVSFEVRAGDIVGVMGRNGSGKSTLLKLLSRITAPTSGRAWIKGRVASLLEVGTGFNYELTGRENVYLNGSILGLKQHEIDSRYGQIAAFAEIEDFMDTPVKRYSSGMRVRLAFAVAAHLEPDILILDEVLAVGDAKFQEKCLNRIDEIKDSGVTILFVSHSADSVLKLCTQGILLDEGRLVAQGSAREVTEKYLESLHLTRGGGLAPGLPESRVGRFAGRVAEHLLRQNPEGRIVFHAPVDTAEGVNVVDVGWVSTARAKTMRTEPTWSAAPDICTLIISHSRSPEQAARDSHLLLPAGAREVWIVQPGGQITRHERQMHGNWRKDRQKVTIDFFRD